MLVTQSGDEMRSLLTVLALALALLTCGCGAAVQAAPDERPTTRRHTADTNWARSLLGSVRHVDRSTDWSGYTALRGRFTAVSGRLQVPQPAANLRSPGAVSSWVGIGGWRSRDLIQAGVDATVGRGEVSYEVWWEALPAASREVALRASPGDWLHVDIREVAADTWQVSIVNGAQQWHRIVRYRSSHSSAEWIAEQPFTSTGRQLPLARGVTLPFQNGAATVYSGAATIAQLGPTRTILVSRGGAVQADPSPLGPDGASFSVTTR